MASAQGTLKILGRWRYLVFTGPSFAGNSTTLHLINGGTSKRTMLEHSRSLSTIDNAYYYPASQNESYGVSVFSHHGEVQICGHVLLAVAHHLQPQPNDARVELATSAFVHQSQWQERRLWISLPAFHWKTLNLSLLKNALEDAGVYVDTLLHFQSNVWVAITKDANALAAFSIADFPWDQFDALKPGALIISAAMNGAGYCYRYFSPWFGKMEDSATGSAHCYLGGYWLRDGAYANTCQLSPAGTALMQVRLDGEQVWVSGNVALDEA